MFLPLGLLFRPEGMVALEVRYFKPCGIGGRSWLAFDPVMT